MVRRSRRTKRILCILVTDIRFRRTSDSQLRVASNKVTFASSQRTLDYILSPFTKLNFDLLFRLKEHLIIFLYPVRCEKNCFTVTSIPLRVCKSSTIHKNQGMSIGPGKPFERKNPGSELFAFSRITDISALPICDTNNDITFKTLKKIWTGSSYIKIIIRLVVKDKIYYLS